MRTPDSGLILRYVADTVYGQTYRRLSWGLRCGWCCMLMRANATLWYESHVYEGTRRTNVSLHEWRWRFARNALCLPPSFCVTLDGYRPEA